MRAPLDPFDRLPRRLLSRCTFCKRLMFYRRERYCEHCLNDVRKLAAEVLDN